MNKIFSNQYFRNSLFIVIGLFIGWAVFHSSEKKEETPSADVSAVKVEGEEKRVEREAGKTEAED